MTHRIAVLGAAIALPAMIAASAWWWSGSAPDTGSQSGGAQAAEAALPVPPVPPRIAEGAEYEKCLAMLPADPQGAGDYAEAWAARGGGEGAAHCAALSKVELGNTEAGATDLQRLAGGSHGGEAARAAIYGQADQAWLMAGKAAEAYGAATLGLSLSPDDADLLLDRAIAAGSLNRFQDALDDLTHVLELDPKRPDALVLRGSSWRHLGHLDLAQDDVDRALALDPGSPDGLLERGILRQRHNDARGARADWERAIDLAPDGPTADLAQQNLALLDAGPEQK